MAMDFNTNSIIGIVTLLVTCVPGVLFLLRLRAKRRVARQQAAARGLPAMFSAVGDIISAPFPCNVLKVYAEATFALMSTRNLVDTMKLHTAGT